MLRYFATFELVSICIDVLQDVTCEVVPQDNILIGSDFTISVVISNKSTNTRTVAGQLSCHSVRYTGVRAKTIKAVHIQTVIAPGHGMREKISKSFATSEFSFVETVNINLEKQILNAERLKRHSILSKTFQP